jgi:hypothetical protein
MGYVTSGARALAVLDADLLVQQVLRRGTWVER